jgi:hypothetical protein
MSKGGLMTSLGLVIIAVPFLGMPSLAKTIILLVSGVLIAFLGILIREERRWLLRALSGDSETDAYTENGLPSARDPFALETREYAKTPQETT